MEIVFSFFTFCHRFIEYGEYKNNYYGTSLDSVRSVLAKNKVCLLDVQPHVSKACLLDSCSSPCCVYRCKEKIISEKVYFIPCWMTVEWVCWVPLSQQDSLKGREEGKFNKYWQAFSFLIKGIESLKHNIKDLITKCSYIFINLSAHLS